MNKKIFQRVANYSAIIWIISIIGVVSIVGLASKLVTHDPDFGVGEPEHVYLLPMLIFFFIGLITFGLLVISSLIVFVKKEPTTYKPLLGLATKNIVLVAVVLLLGVGSFFLGYRQALVPANEAFYNAPRYTGQEVFDAINNHRISKRLNALVLDQYICDNLVQRYLDITNPDNKYQGHAGFEEWIKKEGISDKYEGAELYILNSPSPDEAVKWWEGSPGHRLSLEGNYTVGCAYASEGNVVAILGNKK